MSPIVHAETIESPSAYGADTIVPELPYTLSEPSIRIVVKEDQG